jgi:hypothetical protein
MAKNHVISLLGVQVTPSTHRYLQRLFELGIFEGPVGSQTLHPAIVSLVEAAHQVLAGGTATVQVTAPGNPQVVAELQGLAKDGTDDSNAANNNAGVAIAALPP